MLCHEFRGALRWCLVPLAVAIGPWAGVAAAQSNADMTLTGILLGPTPVAIIRAGEHTFITRVGEPVGDAVVAAILPGKVVLKRGAATFELPAQSAGRVLPTPAVSPNSPSPVNTVQPRRVQPVPAAHPRNAPAAAGMVVTGILGGAYRVAILQAGGQSFVAAAGDRVGDAVVVSVLPRQVILKRAGAVFELSLGRTAGGNSPN